MEVHAPGHALNGWRDFFIHMGTITLGLLIALGLENLAEALHQRHRVAETREALKKELEYNQRYAAFGTWVVRREWWVYNNDLKVLRYVKEHPGVTADKLPGAMYWTGLSIDFLHTAWDTAKATGVTEHMPIEEVHNTDALYKLLENVTADNHKVFPEVEQTAARLQFTSDRDPTHLTPAELDTLIAEVNRILADEFVVAVRLENISHLEGFPKTVSTEELAQWQGRGDLQKLYGPGGAETQRQLKEFSAAQPKPE